MTVRRHKRKPAAQLSEIASSIARDCADEAGAREMLAHTLSVGLISYDEARQLETMVVERVRQRAEATCVA